MRENQKKGIWSFGPLICLLIMKQQNILSCFIPIYQLVDGSIVYYYNLCFSHHLLLINASAVGTFLDPENLVGLAVPNHIIHGVMLYICINLHFHTI